MFVIVGLHACMKPHSDLNFCRQDAYGEWNPRINVLACVKYNRLKTDIDWQQSDLLNIEAVGYSSARLINSFHSGMSAPIDSSLCKLTRSLKKLLCGHSLDNVCSIQWGLHHEPVAVNQYKVPGAEVVETNVFIVLGIL